MKEVIIKVLIIIDYNINHSAKEYANGMAPNGIESVWTVLKKLKIIAIIIMGLCTSAQGLGSGYVNMLKNETIEYTLPMRFSGSIINIIMRKI